ncbi:MAG: alcohol dehydrogenase catalytic domain-containing protein [Acidobacteria bacterium]|nr:alcohol dehydrogenase catalytic domain-containing protein [Acidobacteriota bacterium]NIM63389.1 alcohol dehydrogenase catalytic domain-containing protein [Acidobacteriota bacterium]NIO60433.1 alcohol dehydrogenase catalytic domain-containing protein [Acidobacteriota bacterium]NIQ31528.1 alcohol dehydrogenase catalytic domain-containing protein [Acidobacteriota bacterium]NIQ86764.1 alcohol dehydrogenase catalytic domain-containing protein [Acidobacteriota bacterium]
MRVEASGICGSDVMEWYRKPRAPQVLGHEVSGVVEALGEGVDAFAPGDRIVSTHHVPCNDCRYCRRGLHNVCESMHRTSFDPGGFSEFVRLPEVNVQRGTFKLPDSVSFDAATFVEPLACVLRGQRLAGVTRGDSVLVIGAGISGILQIQAARAHGAAKVFAADVQPTRLDMARRFGADEAWEASEPLAERLRAANDGRLADRVLVCTGARAALEGALELIDHGGSLLVFAPLTPGETLALDVNDLWKRGVSIVHSYAGPPEDMRSALGWIGAGRVDVEGMITHRLPLARTGEGFRLVAESGDSLKVLIEPGR